MTNKELERAILGCILIDREAIDTAFKMALNQRDFHNKLNRTVYRAMMIIHLYEEKPIDLITLHKTFKQWKLKWDKEYFAGLTLEVPTAANLGHYIKELKRGEEGNLDK